MFNDRQPQVATNNILSYFFMLHRIIIPIITKKYVQSRYCVSELYTADGDKKTILPIIYEEVDFIEGDLAKGVKFIISGINWTMCRPGVDNIAHSMEKLMEAVRNTCAYDCANRAHHKPTL